MDILYRMYQERQAMLRKLPTTPPYPYDPDELCGHSAKNDTIVTSTRFYVAGVSLGATAFLGILGNLLSIITLWTLTKRGLFIKLLLALTCFDLIFLCSGGIFMLQQAFNFNNELYNTLFPIVIYPLAGFSMTASTYACLSVAFERYISICRGQTDSSFVTKKVRYYILVILLISAIVDVPRFFELTPDIDDEGVFQGFAYTELRQNPLYITVYTLWVRLIVTAALPFILMVFFTFRILIYYRGNDSLINQIMSPHQSISNTPNSAPNTLNSTQQPPNNDGSTHSNYSNSEKALYLTFFCLTTTFLFCHLPRIILNVYEVPMSHYREVCWDRFHRHYFQPSWLMVLSYFEKLFLILNSSINFLFFCLVSKMFRKQMIKVIAGRMAKICRIQTEAIIAMDNWDTSERRRNQNECTNNHHGNGGQTYHAFTSGLEEDTNAINTMETGIPNSESSSVESSSMLCLTKRQSFRAKMKSIEEETVAILEHPEASTSSAMIEEQPFRGGNISTPNLMTLTVNMPYGSYLGHEVLSNTVISVKDNKIVSSVTKMTSTSDLMEDIEENDFSDVDDDSISSCSAGSNSSCSSSFDEKCPHCVISVNSKGTFTGDHESPVFL